MIYMISDNKWDPLNTQLPNHSLDTGSLKYKNPRKYADYSEYDILKGIVYNTYCTKMLEGLTCNRNNFISAITTKDFIDPKLIA